MGHGLDGLDTDFGDVKCRLEKFVSNPSNLFDPRPIVVVYEGRLSFHEEIISGNPTCGACFSSQRGRRLWQSNDAQKDTTHSHDQVVERPKRGHFRTSRPANWLHFAKNVLLTESLWLLGQNTDRHKYPIFRAAPGGCLMPRFVLATPPNVLPSLAEIDLVFPSRPHHFLDVWRQYGDKNGWCWPASLRCLPTAH